MLKIYVARHGQDRDNAKGILNGWRNEPLTDIGLAQAATLARRIVDAGLRFDKVYCSPLLRARQTARKVTDALAMKEPWPLPGIIERHFGIMTGKRASTIERTCAPYIVKTDTITYFLAPEHGETFPVVLVRAEKVLDLIRARHADGNVLLVTHGDTGKMLYAAYYGFPWMDVLTGFHFGNAELLELSDTAPVGESHVFRFEQHNH